MMPEQQQRILGYFIEEAKDHLNTIEQGLLNLQATIEDAETVNEVFRAAHSIKGGAAMLGIDSVQRTSHRLEDYFKILKESPVQVDRTLESMFLQIFDGLQSLVEELQSPFGLTDEKAQEVMAATEPVFGQLESHLNTLVQGGKTPATAAVAATPAAPPAPATAKVASRHTEESALKLVFRSDVPGHLREMLNLFKQPDTADSRRSLQSVCGALLRIGEQFELGSWCALVRTAQQVVGNPEQTYRTLAPVVIKDLKQGQEQVLSGRSDLISPSDAMVALMPAMPIPDEAELDDLLDAALSAPEEETDFTDLFGGSDADVEAVGSQADVTGSDSRSSLADDLDWLGLGTPPASPADDLTAFMGGGFGGLSHAPVAPGAEVGAAELNSLADLFEGEVENLENPWGDGVLQGDRNGTLLPLADDFSDLLLSEEEDLAEDDLGLDGIDAMDSQEELASLFGDVDLEATPEVPSGMGTVSEDDVELADGLDLTFPEAVDDLGLALVDLASPPAEEPVTPDNGTESVLGLVGWAPEADLDLGPEREIAAMAGEPEPESADDPLDLFNLDPSPSATTADPDDFFSLGSTAPVSQPCQDTEGDLGFEDWFDTPTVSSPAQTPTAVQPSAPPPTRSQPEPKGPSASEAAIGTSPLPLADPALDALDFSTDLEDADLDMNLDGDLGLGRPNPEASELELDLGFDLALDAPAEAPDSAIPDLGLGTIPGDSSDDFDLDLALDLGDATGTGVPDAIGAIAPVELDELAMDDPALGALDSAAPESSDADPLANLWTTPDPTMDPWATPGEPTDDDASGLSTLEHLWNSLPAAATPTDEPDTLGDLRWEATPPSSEAADLGLDFPELEDLEALDAAIAPTASPAETITSSRNNLDEDNVEDPFTDLESLLEDEPSAALPLEEPSAIGDDDFEDLDALLSDQPSPETNDCGDLDALLAAEPPRSGIPPDREVEDDEDDDFRALENLLGDADKTLGGPPAALGRNTPPSRVNRRATAMMDQTMRVSVKHLDTLSNLVGELVVNRNSLEQDQERLRQFLDNLLFQVQQLNDVGQRMRDLYERSLLESSLISSRHAFHNGHSHNSGRSQESHATGATFDALEMDRFTGFHTLSQEMIELIVRVRESASDIGYTVESSDQITRQFRQVTTQLQEGLNKARMVPFAQTADRLPRAVRDISMKCGKEARLVVEGRDTLIDKMILERLYDPMTHLVNNAITHGIEPPDERMAAGKPREGTITVRAFYQGNQTVIYIADDGGGINPDIVKQKAIKKGLITQAEARAMSTVETYELLFRPGFSTRDQADDFAGRGVGMDVVRTALSEIRGAVTIDSELGRGTSFTIRLPLTLSISKALRCLNNQAHIAFPMDGVEDMFDVPKERVQVDSQGRSSILWRDTTLYFQPLSDLLHFNRTLGRGRVYGGSQDEDMVSIVVLRSANTHIGLQVDRVLGEQEIVIKQLEGPVPKPVGIAGATVLGDGRVMPIADVLELIDLSQGRVRRDSASSLWSQEDMPPVGDVVEPKAEPTVLIVDDSITVRELLSMSFNKVGYRVEQARDGQEAWEKLRSGLPCDLVFCDIEMPRMDGLELLSRLQKDPTLKTVPIAMLTSRGADRHRQMALDLGASGYFTKPYLEEALLDAAQRMLNGEVLLQPAAAEP